MKNPLNYFLIPLIIVFLLIVWIISWSLNKRNTFEEKQVVNSRLLENIESTRDILPTTFPGSLNYSSVLFYRNNEIDSIAITNAPIAYSPYYHFLGYVVKENTLFSFGWGFKNPEHVPNYDSVINTSKLCVDEDMYYKIIYDDVNGASYCGDVLFCYFGLDE